MIQHTVRHLLGTGVIALMLATSAAVGTTVVAHADSRATIGESIHNDTSAMSLGSMTAPHAHRATASR
jgi:hypothetical protein